MNDRRWTTRTTPAGALAALALAVLPAHAGAQQHRAAGDTAAVEVGDRVRVTIEGAREPAVGWIDALGRGEFTLVRERDHESVRIQEEVIRRLEVSRVRRSGFEQAAPGLIVGGMLGLAAGMAFTEETSCEPDSLLCFDFGSEKLMAGLGAAGLGMLVGGLVSAAIVPAESWEGAEPPGTTLGAVRRGPALTLALSLPARGRP